MKRLQVLLFAAALGLPAAGAAVAAEQHAVKGCSKYGPGFRYVPGTDVCVKIGGWARAEAGGGGAINWGALNSNPGDRTTANTAVGARGYLTTDVRKQTDYGAVRAYLSVGASHQ
jgi:Porin subfamily